MEKNTVNGKRGAFSRGIDGIPNKRVPDVAKMDTYLVSSTGQEVALDQGKSLTVADKDAVIGPGGSPFLDYGHAEPVVRIPADRLVDDPRVFAWESPGEGQVSFFDRT
jgi:hypothetical protein